MPFGKRLNGYQKLKFALGRVENIVGKLKAFADDKLNVYQKLKFALRRVENIVGKGENADYQQFLFFPQSFQKASSLGSLKVGIV